MSAKGAKETIHVFLEEPATLHALSFRYFIVLLIVVTAALVAIEYFHPATYMRHEALLVAIDRAILGTFTIELMLRWYSSPKRGGFFRNPYNVIDLMAVAPGLVGLADATALRTLRAVRLLKLVPEFRYMSLFRFRGTILEKIAPVVLMFVALKLTIWFLENAGLWIEGPSLGNLFTVFGLSIGIVLSLKLGATYQKYLRINEVVLRIRGRLLHLQALLERHSDELDRGRDAVQTWARLFIELFNEKTTNTEKFQSANETLLDFTGSIEKQPGPISVLHSELSGDAAFILGIGRGRTPQAYNDLLHQAVLIYLILIALFIPGALGLIAVAIATHLLYGIYYITLDLDSIIGGEFHLVQVDLSAIEEIARGSVAERTG